MKIEDCELRRLKFNQSDKFNFNPFYSDSLNFNPPIHNLRSPARGPMRTWESAKCEIARVIRRSVRSVRKYSWKEQIHRPSLSLFYFLARSIIPRYFLPFFIFFLFFSLFPFLPLFLLSSSPPSPLSLSLLLSVHLWDAEHTHMRACVHACVRPDALASEGVRGCRRRR